jgi:hypothetical protein
MGQKAQVGGRACRYGDMDPDAPAAPRCPTCGTGIQPHWDWCHFCGYDPDHLKPAGWIPGVEPRAEPEPTGRRNKRAARNGEKRSNRKAEKGRKGAKQAATAREPVTAGVVPVAAGLAPSPPPPSIVAAPIPVVDEDTVDIASMLDPFVLHDDDEPARPPRRSSIPPLVIESTPARPNARPVVPTADVFHVKPAAIELGVAAVLALVGLGAAYLGITGIIQVAEGASTTMLDNISTVFFILLCSVAAFAALAQARALLRQSVELTPTELTVHNRFGRVRRVARNEIHALRMSERQYPTPKGLTSDLSVPYVQLTDGSGIWLDALGARNPNASPTDEQQSMYDRLAASLASTGTRL